MDKFCCTKETCSHNEKDDDSSEKSLFWKRVDNYTQMSPNAEMSSISMEQNKMPGISEYICYDCDKHDKNRHDRDKHNKYYYDKDKHVKYNYDKVPKPRKFRDINISEVYHHLENPKLFRRSLMKVACLTQQLNNYFEQQLTQVPKKHSSKKSYDKHKLRTEPKTSSANPIIFDIPIEIHLKDFTEKSRQTETKCSPTCSCNTKLEKCYLKTTKHKAMNTMSLIASSIDCIIPEKIVQADIRETSSKYFSCESINDAELCSPLDQISNRESRSKDVQTPYIPLHQLENLANIELFQKSQSKDGQGTCITTPFEHDSIPACWSCLKNADSERDFVCDCGVNPENCICDRLKEMEAKELITKVKPYIQLKETTVPVPPPLPSPASITLPTTSRITPSNIPSPPPDPSANKALSPPALPESEDKLKPTTKLCQCGREKLTLKDLEELEELAKKRPNAQASFQICENKLKCSCDLKKPLPPPKPAKKLYRLAYPQHKDIKNICIKCRFEPSPLIDRDGLVFCPGNCGCCLCPWKSYASRSLENILRHNEVKICKCHERLTVYGGLNQIDSDCSQISYFDICPCRERAEAKHMELFGFGISEDMYRGEEVLLKDVREVIPAKTPEKSSQTYFNRNHQNINNTCQNENCPSNTSQTSQLEFTLYDAELINNPWMAAKFTTSPHYCINCRQLFKPTPSSSSFHETPTNTSSVSTMTGDYHIKHKLNKNSKRHRTQSKISPNPLKRNSNREHETIIVANITPRPERLQPLQHLSSQLFLTPNTPSTPDDDDSYYSCESDEGEGNQLTACAEEENLGNVPKNIKVAKKNLAILKLLQEVVHLITGNNSSSVGGKDFSINMASTQTKEIVCIPLKQSETSTIQSGSASTPSPSKIVQENRKNLKPNGDIASRQQPIAPPQLALPIWPAYYCYSCGVSLAQGQPIPLVPFPIDNTNIPIVSNMEQGQAIPNAFPININNGKIPLNYTTPILTEPEAPVSFVYQQEELKPKLEFHMQEELERHSYELSPSKTDFRCICPKYTDVCPKHGPLENLLKDLKPSCPCFDDGKMCELGVATVKEEQAICTCPTKEEECPIHGIIKRAEKEKINDELQYKLVNKEEFNPFNNYDSNAKMGVLADDDELLWGEKYSKPIEDYEMKLKETPSEREVHNEWKHHYVQKEEPKYSDQEEVHEELQSHYVKKEEPNYNSDDNYNIRPDEETENPYLYKPASVDDVEKKEMAIPKEVPEILEEVAAMEASPYIVRTSTTTGRNVYNFLPVLDGGEVEMDEYQEQVGRYTPEEEEDDNNSLYPNEEFEELEEESELAKERRTEHVKKKKYDTDDNDREKNMNNNMALATMQQLKGEGSPEEMKFFIDSLILDLDAMEHARRKSAIEKNIYMPRRTMSLRESFPVTITEVTDLGTTSLYIKWIIHDCYGIGGYEIYTDGYLTNRYFHYKHEAAVITNVDITVPHKIILMAQPSADDDSLELICKREKSNNKIRSLPWKPEFEKEQVSSYPGPPSSLWTPSIYLYDPATCRALAKPPIMRGSL